MNWFSRHILGLILASALAQPAAADVIIDWNEKVVAFTVARGLGPPQSERLQAMVHLAMFDAINAVERRYRPYLVEFARPVPASKEVAAASAAGTVLAGVDPATAPEIRQDLAAYIARIPDSADKQEGIKLGEAVAARMLTARSNDGSTAPETYGPRTSPGVYVGTAPLLVPQWREVKPFALKSADQFRPGPPVALASREWATDYNEIKDIGGRNSTKRTARQTEDARFWLAVDGRVYYPVVRTIAAQRKLPLVDSARLFALVAAARADALIAVLDAKYHYNFWRPVTAIRNGDVDDNPATERDAAWLPIDMTPPHPEYPCAHCIVSASIVGVVEEMFGTPDMPEVAFESPTLPRVVHRWTDIRAFEQEIAEARIHAGFHYRFSTKVGQDMGLRIGRYLVDNFLQPIESQGGGEGG